MSPSQPPTDTNDAVLTRIWAAITSSVVIYGVLLRFVVHKTAHPVDLTVIQPLLVLAAVSSAGLSLWWRNRASAASSYVSPTGDMTQDTGQSHTNCIVVWALSESVAIFGLVLGFLSGRFEDFVPFGIAAISLLIFHRQANWPR